MYGHMNERTIIEWGERAENWCVRDKFDLIFLN